MAKFTKTVLIEDRDYHSPDGIVTASPDAKAHWASKVGEFVNQGFSIPCWWDHQADPSRSRPIQFAGGKRRRAKDQAGWLTGAKVAEDGGLELEFDVPGKDADQVGSNITKVSPVFWDRLKDGRGETHENVIGGCDFVTHPVDDTQTDFEPAESIACSLVKHDPDAADDEPKIIRFAEGPPEKDKSGSDGDMPETEVTNEDNRLKKVMEALAKQKIILSDDTDQENFLEHLEQALLTVAAMQGQDEMSMNPEQEQLTPEKPEMAMMSLEGKRYAAWASNQHRKTINARLKALLENGQCTPAEYEERKDQPKKLSLSLDDDGNHEPTQLEAWIDSREAIPPGTFWSPEKRTRMAGLDVVPHPGHVMGDEVTDEEADKLADEVFGVR
jgi:hypothetical protein